MSLVNGGANCVLSDGDAYEIPRSFSFQKYLLGIV